MTKQELMVLFQSNPSAGVTAVLSNNLPAVQANAQNLGLFTYMAPPEDIVQAINELINQGNIATVKTLLTVPFNPQGPNANVYSAAFSNPTGKSSDGEEPSTDWWTVALAAALGGLGNLAGQQAAANATNQTPTVPGANNSNPNSTPSSDNTILYIALGFFGLVILGVVVYFIAKASK